MTNTVAPLPPGRIQFFNANGQPLVGGTVATYIPATLTPVNTYTDNTGLVANVNPLTLDDLGSCTMWANGVIRQIVKDSLGNVVWDANTSTFINTGADVILTYTGNPPSTLQWLGGEVAVRILYFAANFAGSRGLAPKTLPTATFTISVQKNGVQVGTAVCSTSGSWTFTTTGGTSVTFNPGDELGFVAPSSVDATMANFGITLFGSFVPS